MEASEYLAFIPLLIYGIALADLLSEWKRLFDPKDWYLPYLLFTIILTEMAVYNIYIYLDLVLQFEGQSYFRYLSFLIPPFLFLLTTNSFTPEKQSVTKEYFIAKMPVFYTLMALFVASHFFYSFNEGAHTIVIRIIAAAVLIIFGYYRKVWSVYLIFVIWLISFVLVKGLSVFS
ncbi:MAG: hypothetical protein QNK30_16405 [Bacteroidales bacterium]|nr:hypothetical protein [Bacteroidales bacterium]